jgi:hypothetical protein
MAVKIKLTHRHYGIHELVDEAEIPGAFRRLGVHWPVRAQCFPIVGEALRCLHADAAEAQRAARRASWRLSGSAAAPYGVPHLRSAE